MRLRFKRLGLEWHVLIYPPITMAGVYVEMSG